MVIRPEIRKDNESYKSSWAHLGKIFFLLLCTKRGERGGNCGSKTYFCLPVQVAVAVAVAAAAAAAVAAA